MILMLRSLNIQHLIKSYLLPYEQGSLVQAFNFGTRDQSSLTSETNCLWCGKVKQLTVDDVTISKCACDRTNFVEDPQLADDIQERLRVIQIVEKDQVLRGVLAQCQASQIIKMMLHDNYVVAPLLEEFNSIWREVHVRVCEAEHAGAFSNRVSEIFGRDFQARFLEPILSNSRLTHNSNNDNFTTALTQLNLNTAVRAGRKTKIGDARTMTDGVSTQAFLLANQVLLTEWFTQSDDFVKLWDLSATFFDKLREVYQLSKGPRFKAHLVFLSRQIKPSILHCWESGSSGGVSANSAMIVWQTLGRMAKLAAKGNNRVDVVFQQAIVDCREDGIWHWTESEVICEAPAVDEETPSEQPKKRSRKGGRRDLRTETDSLLAEVTALLNAT